MRLEELLSYENIAILCHNNPDADAIASGYGIFLYLKAHGKHPRLIYGGPCAIQKSNLLLLIRTYDIPIEYLPDLEEPDLLLTVDCQYGQGNVHPFSAKTVGVIDHHQISDPGNLPVLQEIHSNYGSCSTLVWQMLTEAGYAIDKPLATILYYGLYTDTNKLQEISHPMDKDMRDMLKIDKSAIVLFQNSNLSLDELKIAGHALANYDYHATFRFAIVKANPCDPNILGVISDMLIEVDVIDTCVAYCLLNGNVKISVRSCIKETRADELAGSLASGIGSGGGHLLKAGGYLNGERLKDAYEAGASDLSVSLSDMAHQIFSQRMEKYFREEEIINAASYTPDLSGMHLCKKRTVQIGYAKAEDIFPAGTEVLIRMLEGDVEITIQEGIYIMIGVNHEIYPIHSENFHKNYDISDLPYRFESEYSPTIRQTMTGEIKQLIPYAKSCTSKDLAFVYAKKLSRRTKLFTEWDQGKYILGLPGDYLIVRKENLHDVYIVKKEIFPQIYQVCQPLLPT